MHHHLEVKTPKTNIFNINPQTSIYSFFHDSYLENIVANIVDLDYRWISLAEFRVEHALEARRGRYENDLVRIKDASFDPELDITQFGIVDKFRIDTRPTAERSVSNLLDRLPTVASGKNISQQQSRSFILLHFFLMKLIK